MQRTGARLYFEFATDFVMYFILLTLLLIFCSSHQWTALHGAARYGHPAGPAVCELLIANKADVGTKDATSSWWSLGGAGIGRSRELHPSLT